MPLVIPEATPARRWGAPASWSREERGPGHLTPAGGSGEAALSQRWTRAGPVRRVSGSHSGADGAGRRGSRVPTTRSEEEMTKSRKESFIFKKQTSKLKTRRPSEDLKTQRNAPPWRLPTPKATAPPGRGPTAHGSSRRSGRAGGRSPAAGDGDARPAPASAVGTQANSRLPSAPAHWALPYQAGLLDKGWRTALTLVTMGTLLSGKGRKGDRAACSAHNSWNIWRILECVCVCGGAHDICPQYPVVTTGKPRL